MKKILMMGAFLLSCALSTPAQAETTVTTDADNSVTVHPAGTAPVETGTRTVVVKETPVIITREENPRDFEGEIVKIDTSRGAAPDNQTGGEIVVRDTFGRDRRVQIKPGWIGNYKVGDYVQVHLMADLKEAKDIHTVKRTPDFEGTVVSVDTPSNVIVVRDSRNEDRTVSILPDLITAYKVGDRVRLYEVAARDYQPPRTVQVLR